MKKRIKYSIKSMILFKNKIVSFFQIFTKKLFMKHYRILPFWIIKDMYINLENINL